MYGIEDKLLSILLSILIFGIYKSSRLVSGAFATPAAIFSASWFLFTIVPLVLLFHVPINFMAIFYIFAANLLFFLSAVPFSWVYAIKINSRKKYSMAAFDSKFLSFALCFSVISSLFFSIFLVVINGFSIDEIFFNLIATSGQYAHVRGADGIEYGLVGRLGILFTYLAPVLGGLRSLGERKRLIFGVSMLPSIVTMVIQSQKLVFLVGLCFYFSGVIIARIYSQRLDFPRPKSIVRLILPASLLSYFVLLSFVSRIGGAQDESLEYMLDPLVFSIASYTLGQIYAFSDFFSYTIGWPSLTSFKDDYYSLGQFTFNSIFSMLGFGREFPPGMYDESSWHSNVFETNLFTFFRGLIYDFGVIGSLIFVFLFGLFANYVAYSVFISNRGWLAVVTLISIFVFIFVGYLFSVFVARYVFFTGAALWLLLMINDRMYRLREIS